jgi:hypothetical protein
VVILELIHASMSPNLAGGAYLLDQNQPGFGVIGDSE